jgi:hypothetical protein
MSTATLADPAAPSLVWPYQPTRRALLVRTTYLSGPTAWTESAGVRACEVFGLDAEPTAATRALVEYREGKSRRKVWVALSDIASTPALAAKKMAVHFSALLSAPGAAPQMPVKIGAGSGADKILPAGPAAPAGYCPECWRRGRSSGMQPGGVCSMAHLHTVAHAIETVLTGTQLDARKEAA